MTRVVALVDDLMDRSRISGAIDDVVFARDPEGCREADVVVVDLARHADRVAEIRSVAPGTRIVAFGPHVDRGAARDAAASGADRVLPRSRFFRDPAAALAPG